jgi:hypothetical protein
MFASVTYHAPFGGVAATTSKTLSWLLPTAADDGSAVGTLTNQTINWGTTQGGPYTSSQGVGDGTSTTALVTGLPVGATLYFVIVATDSDGNSAYSAEVSINT